MKGNDTTRHLTRTAVENVCRYFISGDISGPLTHSRFIQYLADEYIKLLTERGLQLPLPTPRYSVWGAFMSAQHRRYHQLIHKRSLTYKRPPLTKDSVLKIVEFLNTMPVSIELANAISSAPAMCIEFHYDVVRESRRLRRLDRKIYSQTVRRLMGIHPAYPFIPPRHYESARSLGLPKWWSINERVVREIRETVQLQN